MICLWLQLYSLNVLVQLLDKKKANRGQSSSYILEEDADKKSDKYNVI